MNGSVPDLPGVFHQSVAHPVTVLLIRSLINSGLGSVYSARLEEMLKPNTEIFRKDQNFPSWSTGFKK